MCDHCKDTGLIHDELGDYDCFCYCEAGDNLARLLSDRREDAACESK